MNKCPDQVDAGADADRQPHPAHPDPELLISLHGQSPVSKCQGRNCQSWLPQIKDEKISQSLSIIICKSLLFLWFSLQKYHAG